MVIGNVFPKIHFIRVISLVDIRQKQQKDLKQKLKRAQLVAGYCYLYDYWNAVYLKDKLWICLSPYLYIFFSDTSFSLGTTLLLGWPWQKNIQATLSKYTTIPLTPFWILSELPYYPLLGWWLSSSHSVFLLPCFCIISIPTYYCLLSPMAKPLLNPLCGTTFHVLSSSWHPTYPIHFTITY